LYRIPERRVIMTNRRILVIAVIFAALAISALAASTGRPQASAAASLIAESDALYIQRADLAKAKEALAKLEQALAAKEDAYSVYWRMSRLEYWIGDHTPGNEAKKPIFQKGIDYAKKAIELGPDKAEGHFWLGVNYGVYGEAKGVLKSLFLVKPIKAEMRRVLEIDATYDRGGADRVLGRVYHEVPGIAGGSEKKSLEHLLKAVEYGPRVGLNLLYLADTYISLDRIDDARKTLESILALEPLPDLIPETAEEQQQAREKLARKPFKKK
jgi:tetratricopeptide (TPR) repeat protein